MSSLINFAISYQMSMNVPMTMVDANTSVSTQEVPTGVNVIVASSSRLMRRVVYLVLEK